MKNEKDILQLKIGLITADEVAFAGGLRGENNGYYYLSTGEWFFTMTPEYFIDGIAYVYTVSNGGNIDSYGGTWTPRGVRAVINLKSETKFIGSGTYNDPYIPS